MYMPSLARGCAPVADPEIAGCAFVLETGEAATLRARLCGAPLKAGSAYCPPHHALCHLPSGSTAEGQQLREIEALARVVGGKQGRAAPAPPPALLRRLTRVERAFSRPGCS